MSLTKKGDEYMENKIFAKLKETSKTYNKEVNSHTYYPVDSFYKDYVKSKNLFIIKGIEKHTYEVNDFDFFTDDMKKIDTENTDLW